MKTILLPLPDDDSSDAELRVNAALTTALLIAKHFGSHVEGLFVRRAPMSGSAPVDLSPTYLDQQREYWLHSTGKAKNHFTSFMSRHDVSDAAISDAADGPTSSWHDEEGELHRTIGQYGRLFDLIVVPRTSDEATESYLPVCEAALFDSGRPVVLAPPTVPDGLGRTVVIGWNGSTETARTISLAMPVLSSAEKVHVLSVEGAMGGMVPGPSGGRVAKHLVRNGIKATAKTVEAKGRSAGAALLMEAATLGADLLVKGAYHHTRLREIVFGGTTRHVLKEAAIPVLLAR